MLSSHAIWSFLWRKITLPLIKIGLIAFLYMWASQWAKDPAFQLIPGISLFYPAAAINILGFYLFGPVAAGGIILGSLLSPWVGEIQVVKGFIQGMLHCIEGFLPFWILTWKGQDPLLYRSSTLYRWLIFGLIGGTLGDATLGVGYQVIRYWPNPDRPFLRWACWWTSDLMMAFCLVLPFIFMIRPWLFRLSPFLRKYLFHPIHHTYRLSKPFHKPVDKRVIILSVITILFLFAIIFGQTSQVTFSTTWAFYLWLFPTLLLALEGGFLPGVLGASLSSWGGFYLLYHFPMAGQPLPIVFNAILIWMLLSLSASLAGYFSDSFYLKMEEQKGLLRYHADLLQATSLWQALQTAADYLFNLLSLKGMLLQWKEKGYHLPEGYTPDKGDQEMTFLLDGATLKAFKDQRDCFVPQDSLLVEQILMELKTSLDKLKLQASLAKEVRKLRVLLSVASHALETLDLDELLQRTTQTLKETFKVHASLVFLYDKTSGLLRLRALSGVEEKVISIHTLSPEEGLIGQAYTTGKPVYVPDVRKASQYIPAIEGIQAECALPLKVEEGVLGVLDLEVQTLHPFDEEELETLEAVATHLAFAVHQADLHGALARAHELLQDTYFMTVESLCNAIEAKDPYTEGHVERTASYAEEMALTLGFSEEDQITLRLAAMLHDIGKIGVPENILKKPAPLQKEEKEKVKQHVHIGIRMLKNIQFLHKAIPIIYHHHEWFDGQGYPEGARGESIPLGARILAVADAFDAMTTTRPYRKALSIDEAVMRLIIEKGRQFDPMVVDRFIEILEKSYNYHPSPTVQALRKLPPLKGQLPEEFEESLSPG